MIYTYFCNSKTFPFVKAFDLGCLSIFKNEACNTLSEDQNAELDMNENPTG